MDVVKSRWAWLRRHWQRVGPYVLVELLLPGGSVLALLLFLYRSGHLEMALAACARAWPWAVPARVPASRGMVRA
jgi:hypothetical protein